MNQEVFEGKGKPGVQGSKTSVACRNTDKGFISQARRTRRFARSARRDITSQHTLICQLLILDTFLNDFLFQQQKFLKKVQQSPVIPICEGKRKTVPVSSSIYCCRLNIQFAILIINKLSFSISVGIAQYKSNLFHQKRLHDYWQFVIKRDLFVAPFKIRLLQCQFQCFYLLYNKKN